ncbi:AAA family ATPase [Kribbella sp. NPDC055071]
MLVLMCGTAYSGKSTLARALAPELDAVVVSLDEINERRGLWGGDGIAVEEWVRTHELATGEVRALFDAGRSVIVDDTSSLRSLRDQWRSLAAGTAFALVYLDVDHATIRRRQSDNRVDGGRQDVTDAVLDQHLADFEVPTPDEEPIRVRSMADLDLALVRD